MNNSLEHITVVGGGTAGWLAAAMILGGRNRRNDGPDIRVTLIESPTVRTVGVGEATTLSMMWTLNLLALDEADFIEQCDATLKAAVKFVGWDKNPDGTSASYYHPFESPPYLFGYSPAYHFHRRGKRGIPQSDFAHTMTSLPAMLDAKKAPRLIDAEEYEGITPYAYHVDASLFASYLKDFCTTLGVEHIVDDVVDVRLDERGFVSELALKERGEVPVQFVIDCSGFQGLIIRQAMEEPFESYADMLPCDRAVAVQVPHAKDSQLDPYTTSTAIDAGWAWNVPLWSRLGTGYVYSSRFRTDEDALQELNALVGPAARDATPNFIKMNLGRSRRGWVNNCVAVGLAGGFVEPLESTSIHLVQMSMRWLLDNFPDRACSPPLRDSYNKLVQNLYEELRDFIAMHYHLSNRDDTPFWKAARNDLVMSGEILNKLELWHHKLPSPADAPSQLSMFSEWSYLYVLFGKRFFDGITFPIEDSICEEDFDVFLARVEEERAQDLVRAPDHRSLIAALRARPHQPWYRPAAEPVLRSGAAPGA